MPNTNIGPYLLVGFVGNLYRNKSTKLYSKSEVKYMNCIIYVVTKLVLKRITLSNLKDNIYNIMLIAADGRTDHRTSQHGTGDISDHLCKYDDLTVVLSLS